MSSSDTPKTMISSSIVYLLVLCINVKAQQSVTNSFTAELSSTNVTPSSTIFQSLATSSAEILEPSLSASLFPSFQFSMVNSTTSTTQLPSPTTSFQVSTSLSSVLVNNIATSSQSIYISTHHEASYHSTHTTTTTGTSSSLRPDVIPIMTKSSTSSSMMTSSTSEPQPTNGLNTNGGNTDDNEPAASSFLNDLKYIYIIAGIILLLILVIVLLMAIVIVMCQRKRFDKQQMKKKRAKEMMMRAAPPQQQPAVAPTSVVVDRGQQRKNSTPSITSPVVQQSPKKVAKPQAPETAPKNGSLKRKPDATENGGMSDFPLLCRVLQDYDSTHHKARQNSVSSNEIILTAQSPQPLPPTTNSRNESNPAQVKNGRLHHTISLPNETPEQKADMVFVSTPLKPVQLVRPAVVPPQQKTSVLANETASSISSLPSQQPIKASNRDSNDYDELEGITDHPTRMKSMSPPRFTTSRTPIGARIPAMLPLTYKPSTFHRPPKTNKVNRNESIRRSQSTNDIFDDPKYTRLSVGSPTQPIIHEDIYDRLGDSIMPPAVPPKQHGKEPHQHPIKAPLMMKRSFSTMNPNDVSIDSKKKHKDYMSLNQLLEIMETKIPSREASVETDYQDEKFSYDQPNLQL